MHKVVTVALVGAGHRTALYGSYAIKHPDQMKVVAVAEPNPVRRQNMADLHKIPQNMQFKNYQELAAQPLLCSAVINGTMDEVHYCSTIPLLDRGYHVLLEKPITQTKQELLDLESHAKSRNRIVMICHVLRYAPFYRTIKEITASGRIGELRSLHSSENVSYHHMTVGYVRGKWNRAETSTPILMAKCCHDLDLITWMMYDRKPMRVSSFGTLKTFRSENAPKGSAEYCLLGCGVEKDCSYSVRKLYVINDKIGWAEMYVWPDTDMNEQEKLEFLKASPRGRCVYRCDNNQVDHQSVMIEFSDGSIATHNLLCATARPTRTMHIVGTQGEVEGDFESGIIKIRKFNLENGPDFTEEIIDMNTGGGVASGHGGGDLELVADFVKIMQNPSDPALGSALIEDSVNGHLIGFAADESMKKHCVVDL